MVGLLEEASISNLSKRFFVVVPDTPRLYTCGLDAPASKYFLKRATHHHISRSQAPRVTLAHRTPIFSFFIGTIKNNKQFIASCIKHQVYSLYGFNTSLYACKSKTLEKMHATVSGPTPPGTGVYAATFSAIASI